MDIFGYLKEVRELWFRKSDASTVTIKPNTVSDSKNLTFQLPDMSAETATSDTLVGVSVAQTLTNKTLTSPTLNSATIKTASGGTASTISNDTVLKGTTSPADDRTTAQVTAATADVQSATNLNTPSTLVKRDSNGDFVTRAITAAGAPTGPNANVGFIGKASSAVLADSSGVFSGTFSGDISGGQNTTQVDQVGPTGNKKTATQIAQSVSDTTAATSSATPSTLVKRDASGNFSAGTITANLTGNVTGNVSGSSGSFTGSLLGDVTGTQSSTTVATVGGKTATAVATSVNDTVAATNLNTASTIVKRDASGNFSAGTITANVTGNVSGSAGSFSGSLAGDVSGTQSSTSVDKIKGNSVSGTAPTSGQDLVWSGTQWAPVSFSGDVTRTSTGAATVTTVGGVSAANVASGANAANAATNTNTVNTIVKRDGSGNISATLTGSTVTASALNGVTQLSYASTAATPDANQEVDSTSFPLLRITSGTQLKGIKGFTNGKQVLIINESGSDITIYDQSATTSGASISLLGMTGGTSTYTFAKNTAMQFVYDGATGQNLWYPSAGGGGAGGGSTTAVVTGAAAGYAVGTPVYFSGGQVALANATAANLAEVVGLVAQEVSSGTYKICLYGPVTGLPTSVFESGAYPTAGTELFLSTTSGKISASEPTSLGQVSVPLGVYQAGGVIYFAPKRGTVVGGTNARTQLNLTANSSTQVFNAASPTVYPAGELTGWVELGTTAKFHFKAPFARNAGGTDWNISPSYVGDTPPAGFSITMSSAGVITATCPTFIGTGLINYALNAPAVGATFPLAVDASSLTTGTVAAARLPVVVPGTSAGVVAAAGLPGNTTGSAIAAGYVGEKPTPVALSPVTLGGTTYGTTIGSISLSAGTWLIYINSNYYKTAANTAYAIVRLQNTTDATTTLGPITLVATAQGVSLGAWTTIGIVTIASTKTFALQGYDPNNTGTLVIAQNSGGYFGINTVEAVRIA